MPMFWFAVRDIGIAPGFQLHEADAFFVFGDQRVATNHSRQAFGARQRVSAVFRNRYHDDRVVHRTKGLAAGYDITTTQHDEAFGRLAHAVVDAKARGGSDGDPAVSDLNRVGHIAGRAHADKITGLTGGKQQGCANGCYSFQTGLHRYVSGGRYCFLQSAPLCLIPVHWGNGIIDDAASDKPHGGCVIATARKGAYLGD